MTCLEKLHDRLVQSSNAAEERSKGIGLLAAGAAGIGCAASGTDRTGAGMRGTIPPRSATCANLLRTALRRADVPPLAQLAAEPAGVERQDENAVELDAHAARRRLQLGVPARDSRLAIDGDDARSEVHVALVRRHGGPIIANAVAAGFRCVERHLVIGGILREQRRGTRGVALLPGFFVTSQPTLEGCRGQWSSGHGETSRK